MKKYLLLGLVLSTFTACSTVPERNETPLNPSKCIPEEAQKLVGQSGLADKQIKQKTQSDIIRRVEPGQPMTMDYRENRITVTIDPATKKITQATCG